MPWSFQHNKDLQPTCCIKQGWARTCEGRLQSQLSVLGYLYGFLTPVKGLHDFASISRLAFLGVAFLPVHSPRMLWVILGDRGRVRFYTCLPLASHCLRVTKKGYGCSGLHGSTLFSPTSATSLHLSRSVLWVLWAAWFCLSPTFLRLASDLFAIPWERWVAWCYSCFQLIRCSGPHEPTLLSHIRSRPASKLASLVSHLSPTASKYAVDALGRIILHLYRTCLWMLWATWFCTCLPLLSHTCVEVSHRLTPTVSKYAVGALGRMSLLLSPVQWALWAICTCLLVVSLSRALRWINCLQVGCLVLRFRRKVWMPWTSWF